jgi:sugar/nucleoside kinase (ribokinase family)
MSAITEMTVIALGVHVLDTLVRPVEAIPDGDGGQLVEQITMTAAGTAGGTALVLSKLGAKVFSAGAIGADVQGDALLTLLQRDGVDTSLLLRRDDAPTSASVLPIRPDGSRPAFHLIGANGTYGPDDAPWDAIAAATHLHLGGPEFMGGDAAAKVLSFAREHGVVTSLDSLAPGDPDMLEWIAAALPHVDYLLPNDGQVSAGPVRRTWSPGARRWSHGELVALRRRRGPRGPSSSPRTVPSRCLRSPSTWWTPPAAETRSRPASCAVSRWVKPLQPQRFSAVRRQPSSLKVSGPTTAATTWLVCRSSRPRPTRSRNDGRV